MEEELLQGHQKTLRGFVKVKVVGMDYNYKGSDGKRLPDPPPFCPVSLQLDLYNPHHKNAIKVINELNSYLLGYVVKETSDVLTPLLKDDTNASARGIIFFPADLPQQKNKECKKVIFCQVLLFFRVPPKLIPSLPLHFDFREDLSSRDFMLLGTPLASNNCTLEDFDAYMAQRTAHLHHQPGIQQLLNANGSSLMHVLGSPSVRVVNHTENGTDPSPPVDVGSQVLVRNEVACMKCKQKGGSTLFQCARSTCPLLVHQSCIGDVSGSTCLFCLYLARREERLREKKGSDLYMAIEATYKEARRNVIRYLGKNIFIKLRELAGLDPLLPTQVQEQVQEIPCNLNMQQCDSGIGIEGQVVGTSNLMEKSVAKDNNQKVKDAAAGGRKENQRKNEVVGRGKMRVPPRPSLNRSCKKQVPQPQHSEKPIYIGRRRKHPFTKEEEEMLKLGVEKYAKNGLMPWKEILKYGEDVFDKTRTPMDLKDKFRNMMRQKKS